MVQYGLKNPYSLRKIFSRDVDELGNVYTDKINPSPKGLLRFDQNLFNQSKSRYEMFSKISEMWGGKILFLTCSFLAAKLQ